MRLIDADALFMKIDSMCDGCDSHNQVKCGSCYVDDCISVLDDAPTIDAVPVVHGVWIRNLDDLFPLESYLECSICGNRQPIAIDENYCPHCGAKMDRSEEEVDE